MKILAILLILCISAVLTLSRPYQKIIPKGSDDARCLDGSPPALYVDWGSDDRKYIIFFMGGGYCAGVDISGTLETCYQRTKTQFGSSDLLPEQFIGQGYLSTDPKVNPYASWKKIIINYCDGSIHQGFAKDPIQYKDTHLYFRGAANVRSHLEWLVNLHGLADAEKVMLTGVSAGAIATFMWTDYVRSLLKYPQGLFNVIDSGIFLNQPSVRTGMLKLGVSFERLYKVANADESTPLTNCNKYYSGQEYKCLFIEYALNFISGPNIWIESQYDVWSIPNILDVFCLTPSQTGFTLANCNATQLQDIENYRRKLTALSEAIAGRQNNSIWSISCANHGYALLDKFYGTDWQRVPTGTGLTVKDAIINFEKGERVVNIDYAGWPHNIGCAY